MIWIVEKKYGDVSQDLRDVQQSEMEHGKQRVDNHSYNLKIVLGRTYL